MKKIKIYCVNKIIKSYNIYECDNLQQFLDMLLKKVGANAKLIYNLDKKIISVNDMVEYDISNLNKAQLNYLLENKKDFLTKAKQIQESKINEIIVITYNAFNDINITITYNNFEEFLKTFKTLNNGKLNYKANEKLIKIYYKNGDEYIVENLNQEQINYLIAQIKGVKA